MADSLLGRKDRFLCVTRLWPLTDLRTLGADRAFVLEDLKLINERDTPPAILITTLASNSRYT